jgi:hypothetical protein
MRYYRSVLSHFYETIYLSNIVIGKDPKASVIDQEEALKHGIIDRLSQDDSLQSFQSPDYEIIDMNSIYDTYSNVLKGLGKNMTEYLINKETERNDELVDSAASTYPNNSEIEPANKNKRKRESSKNRLMETDICRPCGVSLNWIRDVHMNAFSTINTNKDKLSPSKEMNELESSNEHDEEEIKMKHVKRMVCGGSLEILQSQNGALLGTINKNIGQPRFGSRLSKYKFAELLCQLLSFKNSTSLAIQTRSEIYEDEDELSKNVKVQNILDSPLQIYQLWKKSSKEYRSKFATFIELSSFQNWNDLI